MGTKVALVAGKLGVGLVMPPL